ncbi:MAG TPA: zinc ribbon domain-containing protein [Solirubrobacteraceae bacterium]|nr:zinc ribbon domain-containing protein [Solirubrobacteraceae bacterium]
MTNLAPVPSENQTCANCSAPLVADQRYCLSCGQPVSPVRLAFLDVLETERQAQPASGAVNATPVAFTPYMEPAAGPAWLRRYAPLFGVLSVLLLALIVGLLVGHWVTQSKAPATAQVIKVEGLGGLAGAVATTPTTPTTTTPGAASSKSGSSAKSEEEKEQAEAKAEEKAEEKAPAKAPPAKALSSTKVSKLGTSTGKAHEKELNELSTAPIEVK